MADATNYVFADVPVSATIRSAQRATPDEIVKIAREVWAAVGSSGVAATDNEGNDELLSRLQDEYRDFTESFPVVLRWMVQMRQFSPEALRKYLLKHASADLSTREGFLQLQVEYLVLLYREAHPHPDEAYVKRYRESLTAQLLEEDKCFIKIQKQVDLDFAARSAEVDQDRREQLYRMLLARRVAQEKVEGTAGGGPPKDPHNQQD